MKKYVLFSFLLFPILFVFYTASFSAEYFNDSLLKKKLYEKRREELSAGGGRFSVYTLFPDSTVSETPLGIRPPVHLNAPLTITVDSVDVENERVKREYRILGLKPENYYFIPLSTHQEELRTYNFKKVWNKSIDDNIKNWNKSGKDKDGGITNLNFAIPVGKRFESIVGGKTNIDIDGSQRIEFSGKSEYDVGVIETATSKNSTFPSLTMKQEPRFSIRGNIGDRMTVDISQDSQSGSFSNLGDNIKLKYQGKENDIIKFIEAGNTSLNLSGATFAGYSGSHEGLFGLRTEAKLGPLSLTAIASQEKGEASSKSFKGTAEEASKEIKDYEYKGNTYLFIDFKYRDNFALARDSFDRIQYRSEDSLRVFEVYVDDGVDSNDKNEGTLAYPGTAWPMELYLDKPDNPNVAVNGFFHRLAPSEYYVNRELGFIQFRQRIANEWTVGVYMETQSGEKFGALSYDATNPTTQNNFKLIKRKSQRPTDTDTWDLEWKNVYDIGSGQPIDIDGLEIKIYRKPTDGVARDKQNGVPFIQILGLDKQNEQGNPTPDNKIDLNRGFVDPIRGELVFPLLRPFDSPYTPQGVEEELTEKVPQIYDVFNQKEKEEATKYYIAVKTSNRQATLRIDAGLGGILENSEEVLLNGRKLTKGTDYRINYSSGEVILINEDAKSSNADLKINYQSQNAFQPMQKSLFGVRGEYELFTDSKIGGVFLYNNESTKEKRVRLGNEPSRMMLFDTDTDLKFQPEFLTSLVDMLPGVVASLPSKVNIQAEAARSMPNMNTHGEVEIDAFEGSQNTPLSIMRTNWTFSSKPSANTIRGSGLKKAGILQWYNPWNRVKSEDIWPNKETVAGENTVHVLNLSYGKADGVTSEESYAGLTSSFYGTGIDLSRARFVEVWARGNAGVLKIDMGSISEDWFPVNDPNGPDGILNTEDKPIPGQGRGDGILVEEEDTGLDGLFDEQETGYNSNNRDPNGDNWRYSSETPNDYSHINGTEDNARDSDQAGIPDTEDINLNGILDTRDIYYEYSIDLGDVFDKYLVQDTVPSGDPYGWRLFRIPLWDNPDAVAAGTPERPDSTLIEFARLWLTGVDTTIVQIASIEVVENNWISMGIFDDKNTPVDGESSGIVQISTKNTHENLDYTAPPGVKGEFDTDKKIRMKEQSIVIGVENLAPGHTGFMYRNFEQMDFTDYTALKLYVHGPKDFPLPGSNSRDYELVVRFGGDKDNYYEYRTPVYEGWANENMVDVDFASCTRLKLREDLSDSIVVADTVGLKIYTLKGKPSLNNIKIISVGLKNNKDAGSLTDEVWVDELRLDELRPMAGSAYKADINTDLSGFIQFTGRMTTKTADFHGLNTKKGSGSDDTQWDTSVKMNVDRFAPTRWNLNVPVSVNMGQNESLPRLKSGSDIILPSEEKIKYRTFSRNKAARISYTKRNDPTKKGLTGFVMRWAFEKVSGDYDWGETYNISPSQGENKANNQHYSVRYDVGPTAKSFPLFNWMPVLPTDIGRKVSNAKFFYTPSTLNYRYSFSQRSVYAVDIDGVPELPQRTKSADEEYNLSYSPFNPIRYDFTLTKGHDLFLKKEVSYKEDNRISLSGPEIFNITNKYNYNITYDEDNDPKYSLSSQLGARTIDFRKQFSATADFAFDRFLVDNISGKPKAVQRAPETDKKRPTWHSVFRFLKLADEESDDETKSDEKPSEKKPSNTHVDSLKESSAVDSLIDSSTAEDSLMIETSTIDSLVETVVETVQFEDKDKTEKDIKAEEKKRQEEEKKKKQEEIKKQREEEKRLKAEEKKRQKEEKKREKSSQNLEIGKEPRPKVSKVDSVKTIEEPKKTEEEMKPQESLRTMIVMRLSKSVSPVSFEYRENQNLAYSGISERPDFLTRLGSGRINPPDTVTVVSSRNQSANSKGYSARTSFRMPLEISLKTDMNFEESQTSTSSVNERTQNTTLPNFNLQWSGFENKIPFIKKYLKSMNLTSAYGITKSKSWQNENPEPNNDRQEKKFSPLVGFSTKVMTWFDINCAYNSSNQTNLELSGDTKSLSLVDKSNLTVNINYDLKPEQLPIFKLKTKGSINLRGEYKHDDTTTRRRVGKEKLTLIGDNIADAISLTAEYQFSQKFRGGSRMQFSKSKDITDRVHKINEVSIWCELSFN